MQLNEDGSRYRVDDSNCFRRASTANAFVLVRVISWIVLLYRKLRTIHEATVFEVKQKLVEL